MLPDDPNAPKPKLVECPACHAKVTKDQLKRIGGRLLCPGCAAAWFQDEDEQEKEGS
jgi:formylmethanofuran dehydrogenase subunit E